MDKGAKQIVLPSDSHPAVRRTETRESHTVTPGRHNGRAKRGLGVVLPVQVAFDHRRSYSIRLVLCRCKSVGSGGQHRDEDGNVKEEDLFTAYCDPTSFYCDYTRFYWTQYLMKVKLNVPLRCACVLCVCVCVCVACVCSRQAHTHTHTRAACVCAPDRHTHMLRVSAPDRACVCAPARARVLQTETGPKRPWGWSSNRRRP